MKAVVMAGGLGTRLRPLTYAIPKPMIPIGKKPILEIIIEQLRSSGFDDVVLAVGYRAELVKAYFRNGSELGVNISYLKEDRRLGTAGPLKSLEGSVTEPFLVVNGDILTKASFNDIMRFHFENEAEMTVGVKSHEVQIPFGVITANGSGVGEVKEKPVLEFTIIAGIYVFNPPVLGLIPKDSFYGIPDLIKSLLAANRKVAQYAIKEYWSDLGNIDDFENAEEAFKLWRAVEED